MLRLLSLLALCSAVVAAGCGGDEKTATTVTVERTTAAEPPPDGDAMDETPADEQATYDSAAALGLTRGTVNAAKYCLRVAGAKIGEEEPPSPALIRAKNNYIVLVGRVAKNYPDIDVNGQPLREYLEERAETFRSSGCDSKLVAAIDDAALSLEP